MTAVSDTGARHLRISVVPMPERSGLRAAAEQGTEIIGLLQVAWGDA